MKMPVLDISEYIKNTQKRISGKSTEEALFIFANLYTGANKEELRALILEQYKKPTLLDILDKHITSRDGRLIAKRPRISLDAEHTENNEIAILGSMIERYVLNIGIAVHAQISPGREVLALEHQLREDDFIRLSSLSKIIPQDRINLFGKGLFAGYKGDFITALHILIPQIENFVRVHLKNAGVQTMNIDLNGIQEENGMSTLMKLPEADSVFGENLAFEFRSLFCDPFGPNLRNELAHGLLNEEDCQSTSSIYAWWVAMRLIINEWWNRRHTTDIGE